MEYDYRKYVHQVGGALIVIIENATQRAFMDDPHNLDYQRFLVRVAEGATVEVIEVLDEG